jgi:hypothetical protein
MVRLVPQSHSSALDSVPLHSGKRKGLKSQEDPACNPHSEPEQRDP